MKVIVSVRIPIKNQDFEIEKEYLKKEAKKGWKLLKRGVLFYQFEKSEKKESNYEIDIVPTEHKDITIPGWENVCTRKMGNLQFLAIYYMSESSEQRLLIDERLRLRYYEKRGHLYRTIEIILLLVALVFVTLYFSNSIDTLIWLWLLLSFVLAAMSWFVGRYYRVFQRAKREVQFRLDEVVEIKTRYYIVTKHVAEEEQEILFTSLKGLGTVKKIGKRSYTVDSLLAKEDLKHEILSLTHFDSEKIQITTPYDLWPLGMM